MYLVINECVTAVKVSNFSGYYLRNRSTLDIGALGYIGILYHKEHPPEARHMSPGTPCMQIKIFVKTTSKKKQEERGGKEKTAQIGTNIRARIYKAGLMARSQFASGKSCGRPTRSRFSVVFLGPRANARLVPRFRMALHALRAVLPMATLKISP
jgi:hypothetical protein